MPLTALRPTKALLAVLAAAALGLLSCACTPDKKDGLPHLRAKADATSVSGISSGAYMAGQFQMAHAKTVAGAAIIAGGPYGCSESIFADTMVGPGSAFINLSKAVNGCMLNMLSLWGAADADALAKKARQRADKGEIDPISDVEKDRIYLFSGGSDRTVVEPIVEAAANFYRKLGVPEVNIKFVKDLPAGHAFITDGEGGACERTGEPYINNCHYDQAGALLEHIYGRLSERVSTPAGEYLEFDQNVFTDGLSVHGLAEHGVVYIPPHCRTHEGCRVHIAFHGCAQNRVQVGDAFIKESGLTRWADTNALIVLFPQTAITAFNPQGCWDWWGYTGHDYLTRNAPQIIAVKRMLDALASN